MLKRFWFWILALIMVFGTAYGAQRHMKVGLGYVSPVGDSGWSYAHDQGRKTLEAIDNITIPMWNPFPKARIPKEL